MSETNDFPRGIIAKRRESAPSFVKAQLSFKVEEFKQYMDAKQKNGWVNIDVLESKKGGLYAKLNDFEPKKQEKGTPVPENEDSGLPF